MVIRSTSQKRSQYPAFLKEKRVTLSGNQRGWLVMSAKVRGHKTLVAILQHQLDLAIKSANAMRKLGAHFTSEAAVAKKEKEGGPRDSGGYGIRAAGHGVSASRVRDMVSLQEKLARDLAAKIDWLNAHYRKK